MSAEKQQNELIQLHLFVAHHYGLEDFRNLALRVGVSYDDLPGETLSGRARELILELGRRKRLLELIGALKQSNPSAFAASGFSTDPADIEQLYRFLPGLSSPAAQIPFQGPPPPASYVRRELQETLKGRLLDESEQVVLIEGPSGVGKTSLVARLVNEFKQGGKFPDGILWGDMSEVEPGELLWRFLHALNSEKIVRQVSQATLRDLFWESLDGRQALVVLDTISEPEAVKQILPPGLKSERWAGCRVLLLAISGQGLDQVVDGRIELGPFSETEAMACFELAMDTLAMNRYRDILPDVAQQLEFFPNMIASAAQSFAHGDANPYQYLQQLRQVNEQRQRIRHAFWEAFELNIKGLPAEQVRLLELTAVLSQADFDHHMLAAVALRRPAEVQQELDSLVARGLLQMVTGGRYNRNQAFHEFLQNRLEKWDRYQLDAAHHLLARRCLDMAHDLAGELEAEVHIGVEGPDRPLDYRLVARFQAGLLQDLPHFRTVLRWALENEEWAVLRRFSHFPYLGLLNGLYTNSFRMRLELDMATVVDVTLHHHGQISVFVLKDCVGSRDGLWPALSPGQYLLGVVGNVIGDAQGYEGQVQAALTPAGKADWRSPRAILGDLVMGNVIGGIRQRLPQPPERPELTLNLRAGRVAKTFLVGADLVDSTWTAVRAEGLNFKDADLVGNRFLGCELRETGWYGCDARRMDLSGSDLSDAVFKDVDLRGSLLRDAKLTGAVFVNVDLRGSDLRGADFSNVAMTRLNLEGCQMDGAIWHNATGTPLLSDEDRRFAEHLFSTGFIRVEASDGDEPDPALASDPRFLIDIRADMLFHRAHFSGQTEIKSGYHASAVIHRSYLEGATAFREVVLNGAMIARTHFDGSTIFESVVMRGATISKTHFGGSTLFGRAVLPGLTLSYSHFGGATYFEEVILDGATLLETHFDGSCVFEKFQANLLTITDCHFAAVSLANGSLIMLTVSGSHMPEANFDNSVMTSATFRRADLSRASFRGTDLSRARLQACAVFEAMLDGANLSESIMTSIRLTQSSLVATDLSESWLADVVLDGSNLKQASFRGANLNNVSLIEASLRNADLTGATLEDVDLTGADLSEAKLNQCRLVDVVLDGSYLKQANLTGAHLSNVSLAEAMLRKIDLTGATLRNVNLTGADLTGARLGAINLDQVTLWGVDLSRADWSGAVTLPFVQWQFAAGRQQFAASDLEHPGFEEAYASLQAAAEAGADLDETAVQGAADALIDLLPGTVEAVANTLVPVLSGSGFAVRWDERGLDVRRRTIET